MRSLLLYTSLPFLAFFGLAQPFWGLAIYLSANILRPEMFFWGGYGGSIIFRVSIGAALLGYLFRCQRVLAPLEYREFWLLFWLWLAVVTSLVFASFPLAPLAWDYCEEFFKLLIVGFLILGLVTDENRVMRMTDILLTMTSLLALWGWDQAFRGNERLEGLGGRAFGDSNGVAAFGVLFFPIALHKMLTERDRRQQLFGFVSTGLIAVMMVFTGSRGGFLGLSSAILFLLFRTPKKKALIWCMVIITLIASPVISSRYLERLSTITADREERDFSAGSRPVLWLAGLLIFVDHPLFGVGLLNYPQAKGSYRQVLTGKMDEQLLAYSFQGFKVGHSTWFCQVLAEGGLFLCIPFLWLILGFFLEAHRLRHARPPTYQTQGLHNLLSGLEAGIFGYCVSISFIDGLLYIFLPVQLLLGMQILRIIKEKDIEATGRINRGSVPA